tara:strand:- start:48950 stop:49309 length:360 start_codon:yes stop_codon:yes gene_type:complete
MKRRVLKFMLFILLFIAGFVVLIGVGGVLVRHSHGINTTAVVLQQHSHILLLWRLGLYAGLIGFYPHIMRRVLAKREDISLEKQQQYCRRRYAIALCLFYELVVVQNVLGLLINGVLQL